MRLTRSVPLLLALLWAIPCGAAEGIAWGASWGKALDEAKKVRRPVVLELVADWCPHCERLARTTFKDERVVKAAKDFVWVRVNADHDAILPKKFGTTAYPVILIADPWGSELFRMMGYKSPDEFVAVLKVFQESSADLVRHGEALSKNSHDSGALTGLGDFYRKNGLPEKAIERYREALKTAPSSEKSRIWLGCAQACADRKEWKSAEKEFQAVLADPSAATLHPAANLGLAKSYRAHGKSAEAKPYLEKAAAGAAEDPVAKEARELLSSAVAGS